MKVQISENRWRTHPFLTWRNFHTQELFSERLHNINRSSMAYADIISGFHVNKSQIYTVLLEDEISTRIEHQPNKAADQDFSQLFRQLSKAQVRLKAFCILARVF